jgi:hypothetical protein
LTQLATGVARTADVFTLADHTLEQVRFQLSCLMVPFQEGRIMSTTSTTFTVLCGDAAGWTALGATGTLFC